MITVIRGAGARPSDQVSETFDGVVWRDVVHSGDGIGYGDVFFTPGSRTHWHSHDRGQLLVIRAGAGYVGSEEGAHPVEAGDTVWTPPGVRHWHGASADHFLLHTAISFGGVEWLDPLVESDYPGVSGADQRGRS